MKKQMFVCFLVLAIPSVSAITCRDFTKQEDAQRYHDARGGDTRLDGDKDGEACECLPGGSAYGNPKCDNL